MHWCKKKGQAPQFNLIIAAVLGLVFLAFFIAILIAARGETLNAEFFQQLGCWSTNTIKCGGGAFSGLPSLCTLQTVEEPVDVAKLADLTRDTWWMYKQGECDYGTAIDEVYHVYAFKADKDLTLQSFFAQILQNSRGEPVGDAVERSDYAFLESGSLAQTLCFDKSDEKSSIATDLTLESGKPYYIIFYDDQPETETGDMILISANPSFDADYWHQLFATHPVGPQAPSLSITSRQREGCVSYGPSGVSP